MSTPFDPDQGLIVVAARLIGPKGDLLVRPDHPDGWSKWDNDS
jgi:hypothetical protein